MNKLKNNQNYMNNYGYPNSSLKKALLVKKRRWGQ